MKRFYILFFCLFVTTVGFANDPYARDTVIQAEGLDAQQIYESLKKWFITNAKYDSRYIIEHDDASNKHLVGKMNFPFKVNSLTWGAATGHISVVIDIMTRDGRFKMRLTDFQHFSDDKDWGYKWHLGTITSELPQEWAKGLKKKQQREVYKRVFPRCVEIANTLINDVAEYSKEFKPIEDGDW